MIARLDPKTQARLGDATLQRVGITLALNLFNGAFISSTINSDTRFCFQKQPWENGGFALMTLYMIYEYPNSLPMYVVNNHDIAG